MKTTIAGYLLKTRQQLVPCLALLTACAALLWAPGAHAAPQCQTLFAGQTLDAGQVCVDNTASRLLVTYRTANGWTLDEMHLFIGKSLSEIPQTRTGNPQVGQFPLSATATGAAEYTFDLPLGDHGVYGESLVIAAHAVVMKTQSDGGIRKETGWANGTRMVAKGNWATYFTYVVQVPPVVGACKSTETAFAFGDMTLDELGTGINRWGWQITVDGVQGLSGSKPLYAGAGRNDISKATLVGQLNCQYSGSQLSVTYITNGGYSLKETHVDAGNSYVATGAPGQFGNTHGSLPFGTTVDSHTINVADVDADGIFLVAHATICFH